MNYNRKHDSIRTLYSEYKKGSLLLQPFFQRNLVWTEKAKSRFIESILLKLPIAEIYLYEEEDGTISVIDGQQRLSTIFNFIDKRFTLDGLENLTDANNLDIDFKYNNDFLSFEIYYVILDKSTTKSEIIDMYSRINEYTVNLNDQELRKAAYNDSDFLKISEELSLLEFFEYGHFFTKRKRERMNDVEFISEILALQLDGIQDKKNSLDDFYLENTKMKNYDGEKATFQRIITLIENVFSFKQYFVDEKKKYDGSNPAKNLGTTRFNQQADFYSLFYLFKYIDDNNIPFTSEQQEKFLKFLLLLDYMIEPESDIDILSTYAVKCVSQGNTKNSRDFRYQLLKQAFEFVLTNDENTLTKMLKDDFSEIFEINLELLDLNLIDLKTKINLFYSEIEE